MDVQKKIGSIVARVIPATRVPMQIDVPPFPNTSKLEIYGVPEDDLPFLLGLFGRMLSRLNPVAVTERR